MNGTTGKIDEFVIALDEQGDQPCSSAGVEVAAIVCRQIAVAQHCGDVDRLVVVGGTFHAKIVSPVRVERVSSQ